MSKEKNLGNNSEGNPSLEPQTNVSQIVSAPPPLLTPNEIRIIKKYYDEVLKKSIPKDPDEKDINRAKKRWRTFKWNRKFRTLPLLENNILGGVYAGAAFLVVVIGLRGLHYAPDLLVFIALAVEFVLILCLAFLMFFKVEDFDYLFKTFLNDHFDESPNITNDERMKRVKKEIDILKTENKKLEDFLKNL
ncbi:MAG: hypothetical protein ABSA76_11745 [Bacteroidales bacterium]